jgi:hypothetical protein
MKALLIASVLLFSLRAMSAELGEDKKSECQFANQEKREAKVVEQKNEESKEKASDSSAISK